MEDKLYHYRAELVRIVDGDTVELRIDVGFHFWFRYNVRLMGIDTPEVRGETKAAGLAASAALREKIEGKELFVRTYAPDKYGRWLATLFVDGEDINQWLIDNGFAKPYFGGAKT